MPRRSAALRSARPLTAPAALLVVAGCALGVSIAVALDPVPIESRVADRPIEVADDGFVSSDTCRSCHPAEYASWHHSFHRTMTQVATPETVRADFDGVVVAETAGAPMRLERRGDEFWAEFDDPGWEGPPAERPRITRRVVMITGSHHQNIYWYATGHDRALNVLPAVYLLDEARWVPRSAVVLHPPGQGVATTDGHWNAICIACHTTRGRTGFDTPFGSAPIAAQSVDTTVAELGIACESCHGPAAEHVRVNRNPLRRYARYGGDAGDPTVVQPARLDPARSAEVCGQCHGIWTFRDAADERVANEQGLPYRPGDVLRETRFVAQPKVNGGSPPMRALLAADPAFVRGSFWADGQVRVSGREYNGLIDSPCYASASEPARTMTCLSCHAMHQTPEDPRPASVWADTHQVAARTGGRRRVHGVPRANRRRHSHPHEARGGVRGQPLLQLPHAVHLVRAPAGDPQPYHQQPVRAGERRGRASERVQPVPPRPDAGLDRRLAARLVRVAPPGPRGRGARGRRVRSVGPAGRRRPARHHGLAHGLEAGAAGVRFGLDGPVPGRAPWRPVRCGSLHRRRSATESARLRGRRIRLRSPGGARREAAVDVLRAWRSSPLAERREARLLFTRDGALDTAAMRRLFDARDRRPLFLRE